MSQHFETVLDYQGKIKSLIDNLLIWPQKQFNIQKINDLVFIVNKLINENYKKFRNFVEIMEPKECLNYDIQDFQSLFELKLEQSKDGKNNFNPKDLAKRNNLKFPINRPEIIDNFYCKQIVDRINQIVDQPNLRLIFLQFKELLNNIITIIEQYICVSDIQVNQITIIELACSFTQQLLVQNELTKIKPLIRFHQELCKYPNMKQFQNQLIDLGIVFPIEYNIYLDACKSRIQRLAQTIRIDFECLDFYEFAQAKMFFNNNEYLFLKQIDFPFLHIDDKSIILEYQPLKFYCTLNFKKNGKIVKQGQTIQI